MMGIVTVLPRRTASSEAEAPTTRPAVIDRYTDSYADLLVRIAIARGVWPADAAMPARQTPSLDALDGLRAVGESAGSIM